MGFIKGTLLVFVCVILFLSLFLGNILLTVSSSLEYENVKSELVSFLGDVVNEQFNIEEQMNQLSPIIEFYCQTNSQYMFNYGSYTLTVPCDVAMQGPESLIEAGVTSFVDSYYYAEYDCEFWNCFEEEAIPLFLVSEKARDYWQGKFYFILLISIALSALMFLLVERKTNFFFLLGTFIVVSAIPLLKISQVASFFTSSLGEFQEYISKIVLIFFNQAHSVFVKLVIIGGALVVAGLVLKLFHLGFAISNLFEKIKSKKIESKPNKSDKQIKSKEKEVKLKGKIKSVKSGKEIKLNSKKILGSSKKKTKSK